MIADRFMPGILLKKPAICDKAWIPYSTYEQFTKEREQIQTSKESSDSKYTYREELDKKHVFRMLWFMGLINIYQEKLL